MFKRVGAGLSGRLEERLTVPEDQPTCCRGVDDGVEEGLGSAQPGEAVERITAEKVDVAGQVRTE